MKILRIFSLTSVVVYTVLLMFSCGRVSENGSGGRDNLKETRSIPTSIINKLKGESVPVLYQIKATSVQEENLVSYGFSSTKSGKIIYTGSCFGSTRNAVKGNNHILFIVMVEGKYENCSIQVTDSDGNTSEPLNVPPFKLDFSAPELSMVGDFRIQGRQIKIDIKASELGKLSYKGNCSGNLQQIKKGISEVLISFPGDGKFSDCEMKLRDTSGNTSHPLQIGTVVINTTPPILEEIKPVPENISTDRPSYSFKTTKSGTLNFSGKCRGNVDKAVKGINHISLITVKPGDYRDCEMTITDYYNNKSQPLKISSFVVVGDNS